MDIKRSWRPLLKAFGEYRNKYQQDVINEPQANSKHENIRELSRNTNEFKMDHQVRSKMAAFGNIDMRANFHVILFRPKVCPCAANCLSVDVKFCMFITHKKTLPSTDLKRSL
jgi:hypothetical protein